MKGKTIVSLVLMLFSLSSWAQHFEHPMEKIECSLRRLDRAHIHPSGNFATSQSAVSATSQSASSNWSGYVAATNFTGTSADGTVSYVAGSWVVPTLSATKDSTYCAIWVGIDGYSSPTVEQIGTSHNWSNGTQQNYAWFEMYPNGSYEITGFPVNNGDVIAASVEHVGLNVFQLVISNMTRHVSTAIPRFYTTSPRALRSCAEWVVEAPYSGEILPLSDFKTVTLSNCFAVIKGVSGTINNGVWQNDEITMVGKTGVEAQPSGLLNNGSSFQVAWKAE